MERIVIPGVGAFKDCIHKMKETGFQEALNEEVLKKGKPTLGICLGMQIAVIEYARHKMGWRGANSTEFDLETKYPVVALVTEWKTAM